MYISNELFTFFKFILIGIVISMIFDFFRAYRKTKKVSNKVVVIQDIMYFCIATTIVTFSIVLFLDSIIRLYVFIAIIIGCLIYLSMFSKYIMNIYIWSLKTIKYMFGFILTPIKLVIQLLAKIHNFFKKYVKKCCKKIKYMVSYLHTKFFSVIKKLKFKKKVKKSKKSKKSTKEGSNYEKNA